MYVSWFLYANKEKFGEQVVPKFSTNYIYPVINGFGVALLLMTIIPFVFLRFFATPYSNYPKARNSNGKSLIMTLLINAVNCHYSKFSFDVVARSIYYFYHCFYKSNLIENLTEKLLAITYFALFFSFCSWRTFIVSTYNGVLDSIAMWKFAILQKRQGHNLKV